MFPERITDETSNWGESLGNLEEIFRWGFRIKGFLRIWGIWVPILEGKISGVLILRVVLESGKIVGVFRV